MNQRGIAAIENALLDIKAKALNVPVYEMLGGPVRTRVPVYWSHCGTYRGRNAAAVGVEPLRSYDDVAALGEEVRKRGFKALKTNILPMQDGKLTYFAPGFGRSPGYPELNLDGRILSAMKQQLAAFRAGGRARHGPPPRRQLPLQDRGIHQDRQGLGALRHGLA